MLNVKCTLHSLSLVRMDCNTLCFLCAVAKPLVSDGSAKAHEMSLAYEKSCLNQLDPPLMLQEFVNHGNVVPQHSIC